MKLTPEETRILGSLIEKEYTTPEYYPLSLNALMNACNQKSNRYPVVSYTEELIQSVLDDLRIKALAGQVTGPDMRVPKYKQSMVAKFGFTKAETAVMCVLMLRGPQTVGEIRGRTGRIYEFSSLSEVEEVITSLMQKQPEPFVRKLPRQPGKDARYAHTFYEAEEIPQLSHDEPNTNSRLDELEEKVRQLSEELQVLKDTLAKLLS